MRYPRSGRCRPRPPGAQGSPCRALPDPALPCWSKSLRKSAKRCSFFSRHTAPRSGPTPESLLRRLPAALRTDTAIAAGPRDPARPAGLLYQRGLLPPLCPPRARRTLPGAAPPASGCGGRSAGARGRADPRGPVSTPALSRRRSANCVLLIGWERARGRGRGSPGGAGNLRRVRGPRSEPTLVLSCSTVLSAHNTLPSWRSEQPGANDDRLCKSQVQRVYNKHVTMWNVRKAWRHRY